MTKSQIVTFLVKEYYMLLNDDIDMDGFISEVAESDNSGNGSGNSNGFYVPPAVAIGAGALVRFVNGIPSTPLNPSKPGSGQAKLVNINWVTGADGKPMKLVLPALIDNKYQYPTILGEFIDKVLTRVWVDYTEEEIADNESDPDLKGKKGYYQYIYEDRDDHGALEGTAKASGLPTLQDIFWNVRKSGHKPGEKFYDSQKPWSGQTVYIANVLDRMNPEWHKQHKSTKLLMSKVTVKGDKVTNKEASWFRMSPIQTLGKQLGSSLRADIYIHPEYDVKGKAIDKNAYQFFNMSKAANKQAKLVAAGIEGDEFDEVKMIPGFKEDFIKNTVTLEDFTEEEKLYDVIDIDKVYKFTDYTYILKRLGPIIDAFDTMVGTDFGDRMRTEAKYEAEQKKSAKGNFDKPVESKPVESKPVEAPVADEAPVAKLPTEATVTEAKPAESKPVETPNDVNSFYDNLQF